MNYYINDATGIALKSSSDKIPKGYSLVDESVFEEQEKSAIAALSKGNPELVAILERRAMTKALISGSRSTALK